MTDTKRWSAGVRSSGELLLFANEAGTGGWSVALERAITEFNRATHQRGLSLRIKRTTKQSEAQLTFAVGSKEKFVSAVHGITSSGWDPDQDAIVSADIVVHPSPKVRVFQRKAGSKDYEEVEREAGEGIRVVIIVHEFVHAVGLKNHSDGKAQDVFYSPLEPNAGDRPQDDYMKVPIIKGLKLPPVVLSPQTAKRIKDIWA
jgi:hypothetical protein